MKPSLVILICLLPCTILALYDESSQGKVKLEDIEEEHLESERRSKAAQPSLLPPPLSKQPAKGQPTKIYPPLATDHIQEYHQQSPSTTTHFYPTRAHHHVQPLTDQPTAPEADYQPSSAYQRETIVYLPNNAHGQPLIQGNGLQHQQQLVAPSPVFYYSHDMQQSTQQPTGNGYQVRFVPIGQNDRPDEQHASTGSEVIVSPTSGGNQAPASVVSYSHEQGIGDTKAAGPRPLPGPVRYAPSNEIREPNNAERVYGLQANDFFESQKDIEYAEPANTYGPPELSYSNQQEDDGYSQQIGQQQPSYSAQDEDSQSDQRPAIAYGPPNNQKSDIEYARQEEVDNSGKPAIKYRPTDIVGHSPQIQYGVPDAPFRRPGSQSNQNAYAPRRPDSAARSNEKPFTISFPYPPSFVSITTKQPVYQKSTPIPEPSYNEVSQWQANVMPVHLIPPQESQYRSFGSAQATASPIEFHAAPLIDFFHTRRSKSLLDSYIPSWLVSRMQEEQARQLQQQQQQQQQHTYAIPFPAAATGYNTIAYSTQFENIYGKNSKRSVERVKGHQKKQATPAELATVA